MGIRAFALKQLQAISKIHLTLNYGVASLFKMLTYSYVCCAFSSARALYLNAICIFEMDCTNFTFRFAKRFWAKDSKITHLEVLKWLPKW